MSREAHVRFCESPGVQPPGATRQHRLFSQITKNWRGRPLLNYETIVNLIANTRTATGLHVDCRLDTNPYPTGITISTKAMKEFRRLHVRASEYHGEWNYTVLPDAIVEAAETVDESPDP